MDLNSDVALLAKIKQGSSVAFDAIFRKYYKMLCLNAFFYLKDEDEAKDLVQTFFFEFWEKKLFIKLEGEIKGYLYRSVQNRCLNYIRNQEIIQRKQSEIETREETCDFENSLVRENLYVALEKSLHDLPFQRREALKMVYFENKRYQEAADSMGISINSLKTHLKIGLKNLRDRMKSRKEFTCITIFIVFIIKYIWI